MKSFIRYLGPLCILFAQPSCQPEPNQPILPDLPAATLRLTPSAPQIASLADGTCQEGSSVVRLETAHFQQHTSLGLTPITRALQGVRTRASLESEAVSKTYYGRVFERVCDAGGRNDIEFCVDAKGWHVPYERRAENPLRICRDGHTFDRRTYEYSAIASVAHIQHAAARWRDLTGRSPLPPVVLDVLPTYHEIFTNFYADPGVATVDWFVTDNASYSSGAGEPTITLYPEDASKPREYPKFVETPFVLTHEYGHHVHASLGTDSALARLGLTWNPLQHRVMPRHEGRRGRWKQSDTKRLSLLATMVGGSLEAFADMFWFATSEFDAEGLEILPCVRQTRNPGSDHFDDGQPKRITEAHLGPRGDSTSQSRALPTWARTRQSACGPEPADDPHTIGAIMAHALYRCGESLVSILQDQQRSELQAPKASNDLRARLHLGLTLRWFAHWMEQLDAVLAQDDDPVTIVVSWVDAVLAGAEMLLHEEGLSDAARAQAQHDLNDILAGVVPAAFE